MDPSTCTKILTMSGRMFDLMEPAEADVDLDDIVAGLNQPRFNGHARMSGGQVWTVADHSGFVAHLMHQQGGEIARCAIYGLLHDAHEAYIGDIPTPVANVIDTDGELTALKQRIQLTILGRFGIASPVDWICRAIAAADHKALQIERAAFLPPNERWQVTLDSTQALRAVCTGAMPSHQFKTLFCQYIGVLPNDHRL